MKVKGAAPGRAEGLGPVKPRKWEVTAEGTQWCNTCRDYTEHDRLGCVECYDPARDQIEELEDPDASQFARPSDKETDK
jgi:protein-arginine kinase activator protein McsA